MLDIQFIRDNADLVQDSAKKKNIDVDIDELLKRDDSRRELLQEVEKLRAQRNELVKHTKGVKPSDEVIKNGKQLREKIDAVEKTLAKSEQSFRELLEQVPNIIPDDTPLGGEEANKPEKHWGKAEKLAVKDHLSWGEERGLIDFERGAKVAGNKFYYLKGGLVLLELAVFQYGLQLAEKYGFIPITVPHMVNSRTAAGTGYLPRGEERQIYKVEGEDLNLIATSEMPITGYHADEILELDKPMLYAGLSPSYRMEAGAYGKHARGLFRVHQFNKLELYVFCKPEESEAWHQKLVDLEEELCRGLEIPYQLVRIASEDLGAPAYKKFDIEYWSPVDGEYRELMSCSNVTDFQARRLNIRYRDESGKTVFVHTLNGTAAAFSRLAIALIENHQNKDGSIMIPEALKSFMNGKEKI